MFVFYFDLNLNGICLNVGEYPRFQEARPQFANQPANHINNHLSHVKHCDVLWYISDFAHILDILVNVFNFRFCGW